jgi:hypothetical protein
MKMVYTIMEWYVPYHNYIYSHLPEDKPLSSKHVEDIRMKNHNMNLDNMQFVDLYCTMSKKV